MIDINGGSKNLVAARLSNFTPRAFVFDGVQCVSIEGVLQAFKFSDTAQQQKICLLPAKKAKKIGTEFPEWKKNQVLYWGGIPFTRHSNWYQILLTHLYDTVYDQDPTFKVDILALGDEEICHSIGKAEARETVLTEAEFINQLNRLRQRTNAERKEQERSEYELFVCAVRSGARSSRH